MASLALRFHKWCKNHKCEPVANYNNIAGFLFCYVEKNNGSTRSVSLVLGLLKRYFKIESLNWLSDSDSYKVQLFVLELKYRDTSLSIQKKPLRLFHLLSIINMVNLNNDVTLYGITLLFIGHDGLMRSGELFSKLIVEDILWSTNRLSFQLSLRRSKTHRTGGPIYISFADRSGWSAVKLLKMYLDRFKLWSSYGTTLFPRIIKGRKLNWKQSGDVRWFRKFIKQMVVLIGLDKQFYSGHSLRAGGATDLFVARVPYPIIKKAGRWRSDAALVYHRDDDDVAKVVTEAFQMLEVNRG